MNIGGIMLKEYEAIHIKMIRELEKKRDANRLLREKFERIKRKYERYKIIDKPNFFVKIFKPSVLKKYQESILEYDFLKKEYEKAKQIVEQLQTDEELMKEIDKLKIILSQSRNDISIILNYYIENNIQIILTEDDKKYLMKKISESHYKEAFFQEKRRIEKLEDIMLVHKTNFAPINNEIGTRFSSKVVDIANVTISGKQYDINLRPRRNSVHFSVNHEVMPNNGGSWSLCKYAVLIPLLSVPKWQFVSNNCVDTFTNGKISLNNKAYIICPKEDVDEIKRKNSNVTVIGYEGTNVLDYANSLLWALGYSVELGNDWGFNDTNRQNAYSKLIIENGYSTTQHHSKTKTKIIEEKNYYVCFIIGVIELIKNNPEMHNIDSDIIIKDSKIAEYLYYCDIDTYELFNSYLYEIGVEPYFPVEGINQEDYMNYCKLLIDNAKQLGKRKNMKF